MSSLPPSWTRSLVLAVLAGAAAAACVWSVRGLPIRLEPGRPAWLRLVRGVDGQGRPAPRAVVLLPGLDRRSPRPLLVDVAPSAGASLWARVDEARPAPFRAPTGAAALVVLPSAGTAGARLEISAEDAAIRIQRVSAPAQGARPMLLLAAALLAAGLTLGLQRRFGAPGLGLGLWFASLVALALAPPMLWLSLPEPRALVRLAPALALAAAGWAWGAGVRAASFARGAALLLALVFGAWIRVGFIASDGSWDTEYWKTWMLRADSHGLTRVYGDAQPFDPARLARQARGEEPLWKAPRAGREYVVDYPPLAMASWWASLRALRWLEPGLDRREAENVAVKLPPVIGDVAAVLVLGWTWRAAPARALALGALYWALPVSWISSAVLGFLDAALAPLVAAGLVAAGGGRAAACGALLALACLVKPTAALVAPAAAVALAARGASIARAAAGGLAVGALVLLPYAVAGTLATALVQMYRIAFQERLSGGFPNPWWLIGHALSVAQGTGGLLDPVRFVRVDALSAWARPAGALAFAAAAAFVCWRQRGRPGAGPALLAGAALLFAYGMLAVGVHENHPHPLYLLLFATGLVSARLRLLTAATSAVYVLNMLSLSGLGRFYGPRYAALEPLARAAEAFRMSAGFDLTLLLTAVNLAAFAWMLWRLGPDLDDLARRGPA